MINCATLRKESEAFKGVYRYRTSRNGEAVKGG